jgi:hypothetical protein
VDLLVVLWFDCFFMMCYHLIFFISCHRAL